jgi:hypothetical protein
MMSDIDDVEQFLNANDDEVSNENSLITPVTDNARILKIKVKKYINAFPNDLKDIDITELEHLDELSLQEKYNEIIVSLNNNDNTLIGGAYFMTVGLIENIGTISGYYDLTGLTTNCASNLGIKKALTQLSIEYSDYTLLTRPEEKLVYLTLLNMLTTYQQNKLALTKEQND